jgi:hypothetical protein
MRCTADNSRITANGDRRHKELHGTAPNESDTSTACAYARGLDAKSHLVPVLSHGRIECLPPTTTVSITSLVSILARTPVRPISQPVKLSIREEYKYWYQERSFPVVWLRGQMVRDRPETITGLTN